MRYLWEMTFCFLGGYMTYKIMLGSPLAWGLFTLELELRAQTSNSQEFGTWNWQAFIQSSNYWELGQIIKLTIVWASVKWPCSKWDIKGGMIRNTNDKPKYTWKPIGLRPKKWELGLLTFLSYHWSLWSWPRACHSHSTWDPSWCHLSLVSLIKEGQLWSWQCKCKVDLSEQARKRLLSISKKSLFLELWAFLV